jgi:AcrR family transcriptional regulator
MISPAVRPYGGEAVREALIAAATELFAKFGPGAVSVREIASHAQVNHGLVHRHFGSKEALLTAVLDRLARELAAEMQSDKSRRRPARKALRATRTQGTFWKVLAHTVLEGRQPADGQREFPVMRALVQAAQAGQAAGRFDPQLDPRAITATGTALSLGWLMFEPFLLASTGLDRVSAVRRNRALARVWKSVERGMRPAGR